MRRLFCSFVVVLALIACTTLVANADTQKFSGPDSQTLTVTTNVWLGEANYSFNLGGLSGASGTCWFQCVVTSIFDLNVKGVTYQEKAVDQGQLVSWGIWLWSTPKFYPSSPLRAPEESSWFELTAAALALVMALPRAAKLRRAARA
jgi:hypothetical protein